MRRQDECFGLLFELAHLRMLLAREGRKPRSALGAVLHLIHIFEDSTKLTKAETSFQSTLPATLKKFSFKASEMSLLTTFCRNLKTSITKSC
jgi:hypothetical protein